MSDTPIKRSRKRVIRREELPASKLANTRKPPPPKPKKKVTSAVEKAGPSPSDIRATDLGKQLQEFSEVWREFKPLVIGVDREVFRFIADNKISASKRVVQKLLRQHVQDAHYRENLKPGRKRYHLDGTAVFIDHNEARAKSMEGLGLFCDYSEYKVPQVVLQSEV